MNDAVMSSDAVRSKALALGFDAVGVVSAAPSAERRRRLEDFLASGFHGDMDWLARRVAERADPTMLWPQARSIVMVAMNYGPAEDPLAATHRPANGAVSVYAQGRDYHEVIKPRLKALARWIIENHGGDAKVFVDTAPVMEKPLAESAGIGWRGKHTNLVSRDFGSWLFLGAVFTTAAFASSQTEADHCGACRRCLDACPTDAFPAPYRLDARKCISYLTIEHKGPIPRALRTAIGNRIYGCDDCLAVCPWNKFAEHARDASFHARAELKSPPLEDLAGLDDAAFRARFRGSPAKRTGRNRFIRNVMIAIGNSGDEELAPAALARLDDAAPIVRGAAVWALSQLWRGERFAAEARRRAPDADADVAEEWRLALLEQG